MVRSSNNHVHKEVSSTLGQHSIFSVLVVTERKKDNLPETIINRNTQTVRVVTQRILHWMEILAQ